MSEKRKVIEILNSEKPSDDVLPPKKRQTIETKESLDQVENLVKQILEGQKQISEGQKQILYILKVHHNHGVQNMTEPLKDLLSAFNRHKMQFTERDSTEESSLEFDIINPDKLLKRLFDFVHQVNSSVSEKNRFQDSLFDIRQSNPEEFQLLLDAMESIDFKAKKVNNSFRPIDMFNKDGSKKHCNSIM